MSKWCPKCQRITHNGDKCDFCGHRMEQASSKDLLLKHILQEISDENKTNDTIYPEVKTNQNTSNQNKFFKIIILGIVIIITSLFFLNTEDQIKQSKESTPSKDMVTVIKPTQEEKYSVQEAAKTIIQKNENARIKKLLAVQKVQREREQREQEAQHMKKKRIEVKKVSLQPQKEETREEAKRKLFQQMQFNPTPNPRIVAQENEREKAKRKLLEQMRQ